MEFSSAKDDGTQATLFGSGEQRSRTNTNVQVLIDQRNWKKSKLLRLNMPGEKYLF